MYKLIKSRLNKKAMSQILTVGIIAILAIVSVFILMMIISNIIKNNIALSPDLNCFQLQSDLPISLENACLTQDNQIKLILKKSKTSSFDQSILSILVNFEDKFISFNCNPNICSSCQIRDTINNEEYIIYLTEDKTPKKISVIYSKCLLQTKEINNC